MPATLVLRHTESSRSRIRGERGLASGKSSEPVVASGRGPVLVRLLSLPLLLDGFGGLLSIEGAGVLASVGLVGFTHSQIDIPRTYCWDLNMARGLQS